MIRSKAPSKEFDENYDRIFRKPDCPICNGLGETHLLETSTETMRCETCQGTGKTNGK